MFKVFSENGKLIYRARTAKGLGRFLITIVPHQMIDAVGINPRIREYQIYLTFKPNRDDFKTLEMSRCIPITSNPIKMKNTSYRLRSAFPEEFGEFLIKEGKYGPYRITVEDDEI